MEKSDLYSLQGLQSRILLVLCIPFANSAKYMLETANQL